MERPWVGGLKFAYFILITDCAEAGRDRTHATNAITQTAIREFFR
jgi:hypothetical protein